MVNFYNRLIPGAAPYMRRSEGRKGQRGGGTGQWKGKGCRLLQVPEQLSPKLPCWHIRRRPPLLLLSLSPRITLWGGVRAVGGQCLAAPRFLQQEPS